MSKAKRPKISILHDEIPPHVQEFMHLTRLAELGRLAANVAHEVNNPLMVAQGFAENIELLLEQENLPRDEIRVQVLEIIKACHRMARVINKMNRMSRNQKLRLFVVDLAEVALNAVDFIKTQIADHDVKLEFDFDHPAPIKCDAVQVEQIILNILSNALFALQDLTGPRTIRISFREVGQWQQVLIWNNGPMIPPAVQARIMDPFFTTKDVGDGTGLGLAVSKAIMEVHDGDLSFTSTEDGGTEFCISFPRPEVNPWEERERQQVGRVLVIDRQPNFRRTLHEKFRRLGFTAESYPCYATGIEAVRQAAVAAVVVDIIPGNRESLEFVKELRHALGPAGLIFTTSNFPSARDARSDLKLHGATECFEKPVHAENFNFILKLLKNIKAA